MVFDLSELLFKTQNFELVYRLPVIIFLHNADHLTRDDLLEQLHSLVLKPLFKEVLLLFVQNDAAYFLKKHSQFSIFFPAILSLIVGCF